MLLKNSFFSPRCMHDWLECRFYSPLHLRVSSGSQVGAFQACWVRLWLVVVFACLLLFLFFCYCFCLLVVIFVVVCCFYLLFVLFFCYAYYMLFDV